MKVISAILAILIAVLTGCASQGAAPAEAQAASTQVESVVEAEETVTASEAITVSSGRSDDGYYCCVRRE